MAVRSSRLASLVLKPSTSPPMTIAQLVGYRIGEFAPVASRRGTTVYRQKFAAALAMMRAQVTTLAISTYSTAA